MLTLLSLLGGGGAIGAALLFVPGLRAVIAEAVLSAWRWVAASTTHLLLAALAVAIAWGAWERHGKQSARTALATEKTAYDAERRAALTRQAQVRVTAGRIVKETTVVHEIRTVANRAAGDSYKRAHIVHVAPQAAATATGAGPNPGSPPDTAPATDMVAITPRDFDACTAWVTYGQDWQDFANRLIADGLAKPGGAAEASNGLGATPVLGPIYADLSRSAD